MIEDLRFIERVEPYPVNSAGMSQAAFRTVRILQAYDGHQWFDVPLLTLEMQAI